MKFFNSKAKVILSFLCLLFLSVMMMGILLLASQAMLNGALQRISEIKNIPLETIVNGISKEQPWSVKIKGYAQKFIAIGIFGLIFCILTAWFDKSKINKLLLNRIFTPQPLAIKYILSLTVLIFIFAFVLFISYYRQPLGDDVLYQFTNGHKLYLDDNNGEIGKQVTNVPLLIESMKGIYNFNGGRIMGFALIPLLSIFGQVFIASIAGLCFMFLIVLTMAIISGSFREALNHPMILLLLFLIIFYFNPSISFLLMWTMTSIYVISLILLIAYYFMFQKVFQFGKNKIKINILIVIVFNILGFFAGFTHEVYSFVFLTLVVFLTLKEIIQSKLPLNRIFCHTGLLFGTIACITAPGNFIRLINSHDSVPMANSFSNKLYGNIATNFRMLAGVEYISFLLILVVLFFIYFSYRYIDGNSFRFDFFMKNNAIDIFFLLFLIFIWSVFPYMGVWGTLLFVLWFTIVIFKNVLIYWIDKDKNLLLRIENSYIGAFLIVFIILMLTIVNFNWMRSMAKTTIERHHLISKAIKEKRSKVQVPSYEEICSNRFTINNYNNFANKENETIYYRKYFGVEMYAKQKNEEPKL
ncbi:hypothetical protein A2310_07500 [candidate division WOR-1 bacterium RIFOXYB2_FULL_37_13]|uniref:Glycosyltransferase RgtA/B/C/D-like domain-containing protein n=1 Tax=candidate division WOR-1 bacterium RIFOXYB2_FULL_37_13 TaxID=1802579 RepID=A0A1F4SQ63_UNCSA|nr:MAG: hypothetical protein A2310_07500 [candidate division WOR-1 bacterium RIFOXYB2_FULL_37_13]